MPLYDGSLRGWLDYLKSAGRLLEWAGPCDPVYELAAIAKSNDGSAVLFDLSAGAAGGGAGTRSTGRRVVANLAAGRDLLASAIGCAPGRIARALMAAAADPVPCRSVTREAAPTKARVMENPDLESLLPVPTFTPGDAGPYITGGILVSRHPVTGRLNASVHRLQVMGPD
ncbi:MAG: UbiD family decarboxylase, partial [Firmicutes bacterium]|nr:UbiD family decarboxylase [Bacillota bacterium]